MAFKLYKCKGPAGLPLLEVPDGPTIAERLSPGEIREPDYYELFRRVKRGGANILVACPRGKAKGGQCEVPLRVLRIWHSRRGLPALLRACKDGSLAERRQKAIKTILMDIREAGGPSFGVLDARAPRGVAQSLALVLASVTFVLILSRIMMAF